MRIKNRSGLAAFAGAVLVVSTLSAPPVQAAVGNNLGDQFSHYVDCLNLLISDPTAHSQQCGPGHEWTGPFQYATNYEAGAPPAAPTVKTCTRPDSNWEEDSEAWWSYIECICSEKDSSEEP